MTRGSFTDFMDSIRAFESGVDAARFQSGQVSEAQLRGWVGESNWHAYQTGAMSWNDLQYTSHNSLGFVGYQLGEQLLIDLGYYRDTVYYNNGAATNTWDGSFTGKGGIGSLANLESGLQEGVILDAFGYNLSVIEHGLASAGRTLDDFIGRTSTYMDNGHATTVTLTQTGILAAAHLTGAWGTLNFLLNGATPHDENGTSILSYINQFGNFDPLSTQTLIQAHEQGTTEALAESLWHRDLDHNGTIAGAAPATPPAAPTPPPAAPQQPTAGGTPSTPTDGHSNDGHAGNGHVYEIGWHYGAHDVIAFDPAHDTLDFKWFQAKDFTVHEVNGSTVIDIPTNAESYTLHDVHLSDLHMSNIAALDPGTLQMWDHLI